MSIKTEEPKSPIAFAVTVELTKKQLADQFCAAIEGGSGTWCQNINWAGTRKPKQNPWYSDESLFDEAFVADVEYDEEDGEEGEGKGRKTITFSHLVSGATAMAAKSPQHFADVVTENGDADTGDILLQYIVLGEVVYG